MRKLKFILRPSFGQQRFYPECEFAKAILSIANRTCLVKSEIDLLASAGAEIEIKTTDKEVKND